MLASVLASELGGVLAEASAVGLALASETAGRRTQGWSDRLGRTMPCCSRLLTGVGCGVGAGVGT